MKKRLNWQVPVLLALAVGWLSPAVAGVETLQGERNAKPSQKTVKNTEVRQPRRTTPPAKPPTGSDGTDGATKRLSSMQREQHDQARQVIDNLK